MLTPSGRMSLPLSYLRDTLAGSATFRTLVGAANAAAAKPRIRFYGFDYPQPWTALTVIAIGDAQTFVYPATANGFIYELTTAGTTAATAPTWPVIAGNTVTDGTAVWTARALQTDTDARRANYLTALRLVRPFAIVGVGDEMTVGSNSAAGSLTLFLEADIPAAYQGGFNDAGLWWSNTLGAIITEMQALAGQAGYLDIAAENGFELVYFARAKPEDIAAEGDHFQTEFKVSWSGI